MTRIATHFAAVLSATSAASAAPQVRAGGPAGPTLDAYMRATKIPCQTSAGESPCMIA